MRESAGTTRVVLVLSAGPFLTSLDQTLVNAVFPSILAEHGGALVPVSWVANGAALALASGLVLGGRLADALGAGRAFVFGQFALATCSAALVFAPDLPTLVVARVGLGFSAALVLASSLSLISSAVAQAQRASAVGLYAAMGGAGSVVGPFLGAAAGYTLGWRAGFAILSGVAATVGLVGARWVPRNASLGPRRGGWAPALGASLAIGPLLFALTSGPRLGWSSPEVVAALGTALLVGALLARSRWRRPHGLIPDALGGRGFGAVLVGSLGLGLALGVGLFGLPLFVTQVQAGGFGRGSLALAPGALASIVTAMLCPVLLRAHGARRVGSVGLGLAGAGVLAYALLDPASSFRAVVLLSAFSGLGLGLGIPALAAETLALSGRNETGLASGWFHASRMLGVALGIVAFSVLISQAAGSSPVGDSYRHAFLGCGALVFATFGAWIAFSAEPGKLPVGGSPPVKPAREPSVPS